MFRMISGQICFCFLHSIEWRYSFERVTVVNETRMESVALEVKRRIVDAQNGSLGKV